MEDVKTIVVLSDRFAHSFCDKFIESMILLRVFIENGKTHFLCIDEDAYLQSDDGTDYEEQYEPKVYTLNENAFYDEETAIAFLLAQNTTNIEYKELLLDLVDDFYCHLFGEVIDFIKYPIMESDDIYFCDLELLSLEEKVIAFRNIKTLQRFDVCEVLMPDETVRYMFSYMDKQGKRQLASTVEEAIKEYKV